MNLGVTTMRRRTLSMPRLISPRSAPAIRPSITRLISLTLAAAIVAACGESDSGQTSTGGTGSTGPTGNNSNATVTIVLHGETGKETLDQVAWAIASGVVLRANATRSQLSFFENFDGTGRDETVAVHVPIGQTLSLFAIEIYPYWGDQTPAPPFYNPKPADTAIDNAAVEFDSWSGPSCSGAPFGDCQLLNVQSNVTVTANFRKMASLNMQVIGVGAFIKSISTRVPLQIAPVATTNGINPGPVQTSILEDSADAYAYEVALYSGSQVTLSALEPSGTGITVNFDGWSGGCNAADGPTCVIKWPATPGAPFTYQYSGPQPVPPVLARFQYYLCTQLGVTSVNGSDATSPGRGISCTLHSP
jgi:hypothetical protein